MKRLTLSSLTLLVVGMLGALLCACGNSVESPTGIKPGGDGPAFVLFYTDN